MKRNYIRAQKVGSTTMDRHAHTEKFTKFRGDVWEDDKRTNDTTWMKEVKNKIGVRMKCVWEFSVSASGIGR